MKGFLSIIFISCTIGYASAQVNSQDSLALVSLYNSTNGGAWTNRTNWLQPAPVGSWYGITVSGGRVTQINLPGNNLTGSLPNLSALTALTRLDIQNNFIGNTIPATMNSLTALLHLNLRNNRFSGLIPNLSSLSNLKYFSIGANNFLQFAQPIPAFVVGLSQLEYLGLDNNRLSGVIPTGFSNLTLLKEITVATASSLTPSNEFIAELATIQALERITLMNFNLGGFQINLAPLGGLTNLEFLDIRSTNLNTLPPPNVWVSDSLTIDISTNALDFGDLEPLQGITHPTFVNTGQAPLLFSAINPTAATLVEGDPFELQTFFGGTQNNYVWQKGGVPIPGQTSSVLNLDSIEAAEAGVYRLVMTSNLVTGLTLSTTNITLVVVPRVQSRFAIQQHTPLTQEIGANSYGGYWADTDRDGDEDLLVNNAFDTNPNFLYQNNGDGTFSKVTSGDIVTVRDPGRYVSWGDYDNNGYPDLFASDYTGADNLSNLYQNNGNGTFNRIPFNHNADGGLWADYDNDGDLDLSVMTTSSTPVNNRLYKNMGNGSFEVIDNFVPFTSTWVAGWVDMDNDNDLDYYLTDANLNPSNIRLFRNDQGVFTASTVPLPSGNFMVRTISWADIDGDGDQDFFAENSNGNITSTAESQFYINDGTGQFTRENASVRTGGPRLAGARGTVFGDADNDGDLDLFVNHKHLSASNDLIVQLLLNNGSGFFTVVPVTEQSFGVSDFGTNMSMADYNNDGFLDLFIANFDILIPNRLCRNLQTSNGNHWIKLNLEGTVSNKSAIGARVDIFTGGSRRTRQVLSSSGLSGQNSLLVHSGLGSATTADSVHIWWPSGFLTRRFNLAADQTHSIQETTDLPPPTVTTADSLALVNFYNEMNGPNWTTKTNWLIGKVNTWYGITVDSGKRVSSIALPANLVVGSIPNSFSSLTGLKTINLRQNGVLELPANFNSLVGLTYVNLNSNSLNALPSLTGLTNLDSLIVTNCRLTFEDLEPVASLQGIRYVPQTGIGSLGSSSIVAGFPFSVVQPMGGSANEYQWFTGSAIPIPGANSNSFSIAAVSPADAGSYYLEITNPLVPGLKFSVGAVLAVASPGAQTYFSWPTSGGTSLESGADSYGGYWVDIDNDGDDDLAVNNLNTAGDPRTVDLYENVNGTFTRLINANMPIGDGSRNVTWADSDNDGDLDFYVGDVGFGVLSDGKGAFYRNNGDKTFTRIDLNQNADGGAWIDYNNDGRVDLFTVDSGQSTSVFRNDSTSFTLVPGIFSQGADWTLSFADIDNDRDMDLVQVGKTPNVGFNSLYRNDGSGVYTFLSSSPISTEDHGLARGGSWADIDNDGDMDFFAMNAAPTGPIESAFYFNDGAGSFVKQTSTSILGADVRGRASSFGDTDNDGDIDLVISNGKTGNTGTNLYLNNGNGTFSQATDSVQSFIPVGAATLAQVSLGDANSDGFLDIFAATFSAGQPATIYRNNANSNHWIKFRLSGVQSNRSAIGARIEIKVGGGKQIREVTSQTGLASQNSLVQHFGIGVSSLVDTTKIYWPSGAVQVVTNLPGNLVHTIIEGVNPPTTSVIASDSLALVDMYNSMNGPNWTNKSNWLTGKVNTWYGITTNNMRVTGISLPSNSVSGTMPASFTTLTGLTRLNLNIAFIGTNGVLPADFSNLSALTYLNLRSCSLTQLSQLSGLTNLDTLIVTNNNLTFEDLEPFMSMPGIQYIPQNPVGAATTSNIVSGNPWNMSISVGGSANEYQWFKGGIPTGVTVSAYSIPSVSGSDAGSYQLRITSPLVPGLTLNTQSHVLTMVTPGPQTHFTWPQNDGIINDTPSDSYGGYWADIDNDGDDDLAISNLQGSLTGRSVDLYENNNGVFTRLFNAGMPTDESTRNLTWADYDNDGDPDFYVGDIGFNLLSDFKGAFYRNNGDKTFTRTALDHLSDGGAWEDYDKDGLVDLFTMDAGQPTRVFRNLGNGNFTLAPVAFSQGSDWTLAFADIDNDRDMDFVQVGKAPNSGFNNLFRNDSIGVYTYESSSIISTDNLISARNGSWADIDNDGDLDFFAMANITTGTVQSAFYINDGTGNFTKQTSTTVLGADVRGRSSSFGDLDNDGDLDLVIHNGRAGNLGVNVFLNNGGGTFTQIPASEQTFIPITLPTFAQVSLGDANGDGFLDIFSPTFSTGQPPALYRNVGNGNNWVKFRLNGVQSNRSAIGARIEIRAGGTRQIREVTSQTGLASQNSLIQHFGLDSAAQVDSVKILWPSGIVQHLNNVAANQTIIVQEAADQLDQLILSTPIPFKSVGEAPFAINATSTSGLPVEFTSSNPAVATITNNMVWVWGPGTATITMNQPGDSFYSPAPETSQELIVYPAGDLNTRLVSTMQSGGNSGRGTIIAVDADWGTNTNHQVLHEFDSTTGFKPAGQLLPVADGFLYGMTSRGGAFDRGSIYRIKPDGTDFSTLHTFDIANGGEAYGGLIQASDGDLYGTTASGGPDNFGTVFKIKTDGSGFTKLHDFNGANGQNPYGRLIQATNGYLYGTTVGGGVNSLGTIFRIRTDGTGFELLHSFDEAGGNSSYGGLTQAANGKLYGAAYGGGGIGEWVGSVFRIELDGSAYTKLHTFDNGENGRNPLYGGYLTQGRDGSLYGTTHSASASGGTVFRMANDSTFSTVRALAGSVGSGVVGAPVIGSDGTLYAQALYGGLGYGSIFGVIDGSAFGLNEGIINKVPLLMISETGYYPFMTSPTITYTFRESQTITWDSLQSPVNLGSSPIHLTATLSSGLIPEYRSSNTSVAVVEGDSLRIVGAGSSLITAFHAGNSQFKPTADSISHTITVVDNLVRPSVTASNLIFSNVFSTQMDISFTPGDGEKHLVAIKAGSPFTWEPVDGESYYGSTYLPYAPGYGDEARIVSADSATSIHLTGLDPGVTWYVKVFEYNGTHYPKYLVTNTLSGSRATLALPNVYVITPADGAIGINVTTNVTSRALTGATTYTIQLSSSSDFNADVVEKSGARTQNFTNLAYDTLYYSRVRTDLSPDFGPIKSFRTAPPEQFSYVTSPANNATGVTLNSLSRIITMNNVIGATTYTCELNTSPNFDGISQVRTGARTQTFTGLSPGTTYYSRVRTDLSPNWGQTRQFTTAGAALLTYVTSPANNAVNVSYQPNITVSDVGATSYTVQLSPDQNFSVDVIEQTSPTRTMSFTSLFYNTVYFSRAKTDLDSAWGPTRTFTTNSPLTYSYVTSPANNAVNVNYVVNISSFTVPGATTYTIEANTSSDFTGTSVIRSGGRTLSFTLDPAQTYYVRVSTDLLPGQWGVTRSFTTNSSLAYSYITSPANGATNVPYVTNITAFNVPLATSYIIEANTLPDFTGTSIVKMGTGRTYSFTLAHDQLYHVRVQTNLAPGQWGQTRTFTTGSPQSLAYVTSPANGVIGVPTTVNVTSNPVPGATSYTIELNTDELFTGTPIVRSGAGRTKNFTGLANATTYYARVSTNVAPGLWGPTRSFSTVDPFGRQTGEAWVQGTDEDPAVYEEIAEVRVYPNPFTDQFEVHVQTADQQPLEAQLIDMNGRILFQSSGWMTNKLHSIKGDFSPGVYLLDLRTNEAQKVVRVVRK